ncbi:MAG TPA: hypothetical protein VEL47_06410 [Myxococcota bacterium]|nr:hypothetical protein [Myxococcota bacterium]
MRRSFGLLIALVVCVFMTKALMADCLEAYQTEISRETLLTNKAPYRHMLLALLKAGTASEAWGRWLKHLKNNPAYDKYRLTEGEIVLALDFLNKTKILCQEAKPMKIQAVARSFFGLLNDNEKLLKVMLMHASSLREAVHDRISHIEAVLDRDLNVSRSFDLLQGLDYFANSLDMRSTLSIESLRGDVTALHAGLTLLHKFHPRVGLFDIVREEAKIDRLLHEWDDRETKFLKRLAEINDETLGDPFYKELLDIALNIDQLDANLFQTLRKMSPTQTEIVPIL